MAYTTLEILANRVRSDLEHHFDGRPARLREQLRHLLNLLLTAEVPEPLAELAGSGEVRGLPTHLGALEDYLRSESFLPEALCARYRYLTSEALARGRYRIPRRSWEYFHELAREVEWDPALRVPGIAYEKYPWHDELEKRFASLEVVLDGHALEGMLIGAMEAYLSPRRPRRKGYEIYGINLGMVREERQRRRHGIAIARYVAVMRSQPQLSADADYKAVQPNSRSLDVILDATTALYPQYQAVGDFHSHPYDDFWQLERDRGWEYSQWDEEANMNFAQTLSDRGRQHRLLVSFVVAIARSNRTVARRHFRGMRNTIQMSVGNCRVIVAAYRSLGSGQLTRSNVRLRLAGAVNP